MGRITEYVPRPKVKEGRHEQSVVLVARCKDADGVWRRHPVAVGRNGRVKPRAVLVNGETVLVDDPIYEIRYYEDRKPKFMPAGKDVTAAETERRRIEAQITAINWAQAEDIKIEALPDERKTIKEVFDDYIGDAKDRDATEAWEQAKLLSREFRKFTTKVYVDEIDPREVVRYHAWYASKA